MIKLVAREENQKASTKLNKLRNILLLSLSDLSEASTISKNTIWRIEKGENGISIENFGTLISFYGFDYHEFFDFSKPLPSEAALKKQMERFHKAHRSIAYEVIYKQPELSEVIEHRLLHTSLFNDWVDVETISAFLKTTYGYEYGNVSAGLLGAVKSQLLISRKKRTSPDSKSRYNEYRRNGEG